MTDDLVEDVRHPLIAGHDTKRGSDQRLAEISPDDGVVLIAGGNGAVSAEALDLKATSCTPSLIALFQMQ